MRYTEGHVRFCTVNLQNITNCSSNQGLSAKFYILKLRPNVFVCSLHYFLHIFNECDEYSLQNMKYQNLLIKEVLKPIEETFNKADRMLDKHLAKWKNS
jgi:hypothetical protein